MITEVRCSKDHAAPVPRMPTVTSAANDRRCYDCRCYHNRRARYDYDRPSVRLTSSVRPTVKAGATSTLGTGTVDGDK
jgi:hypothetical protein